MRGLLTKVKRWLRRQRERYLPDEETRVYRRWIAARLRVRNANALNAIEPKLFSIITAVWDGSPAEHFRTLATTIERQNADGAVEWVICDNGCKRSSLANILSRLRALPWVTIAGDGSNAGIAGGLRACLEAAGGRYIVPVDADDDLYPDALAIAASFIRRHNYPALLYSDEDKVIGTQSSQPYFKPDSDPVLLANSAYTAHLGFVDREKALALGAYTNKAAEGSVDWDLFLRFLSAGHTPVHIPEVLYRWRIHGQSTADDGAAKDYIGASQRAALQGFLDRHPEGKKFSVVESPLLPGGAHFRLLRSRDWPLPTQERLVFLVDDGLIVDGDDWMYEAVGIFDLFDDVVVVGGRLLNTSGKVVDADRHFGFGSGCASPNAGRAAADPGYFGQTFKQRSASAVSAQLLAVDSRFLAAALAADATIHDLGVALGRQAMEQGKRVVYSPYITATTDQPSNKPMAMKQIPDRRYYPEPFSLQRGFHIELH